MLGRYFRQLYQDTAARAYELAFSQIAATVTPGSLLLDSGANTGWTLDRIAAKRAITATQYRGIEWNARCVEEARKRGLDVVQGDLNRRLAFADDTFTCVYALSVLEHLLNPCRFLQEAQRVLRPGGRLVLLTPNISTYFTALLILLGRMPSSGPHPDSNVLLKREELFKVSHEGLEPDAEDDTPVHRHLVVFSFRVLRDYLKMIGFTGIQGHGFGVYPFPIFMQPLLERLDPFHSHQMVFVATKAQTPRRP